MKKTLISLTVASSFAIAHADTLYINGKPVDQKIINQTMEQIQKNPNLAQQMKNPQFKKEVLKSIGMQQAILLYGNSQHLDETAAYKAKLNEVKPMIYAELLQNKVDNKVSDAELKAKYEQMKKEAENKTEYNVSHILVKDQKTADDIEAQLKKGANFADLAKKYSIDPGSKNKGGELGWSDGSNYVPEFTAAIKTLKKGQYTTTPVKSQFGYHIIKLDDTRKADMKNFPSFDKIKDQLKQQIQMEKTKAFFDDIKAKYKVEVK